MKLAKLFGDSIVDLCEDDVPVKDFALAKLNSAGRDDKDDAFHVCDLGDIVRKMKRFRENLPRVQPFYAVKCNPDKLVLRQLASLGVNFDCASKGEIKTILDLGVTPERIVFANPCKQNSHIKFARSTNVTLMTFDNELELHKTKQHHPNAQLIIRIKVDDSKSLCKFGIKFGVDPSEAKDLLKAAWDLGLNVVGVSFHVGSGCFEASLFYDAVKSARRVFDQASAIGFKLKVLDVGGGFPGAEGEKVSFEQTALSLNRGFSDFFPAGCGVKIIAEPGRYFVASAFTTICNITSVREVTCGNNNNNSNNNSNNNNNKETQGFMYYLNDGVYGSFNCILFDHTHPVPYAMKSPSPPSEGEGAQLYECSVWGPTCDSLDCISTSTKLPKLTVGDWVCFDNMGAYTMAAASQFNGFKSPSIHYMCHRTTMEESMLEVEHPGGALCKSAAIELNTNTNTAATAATCKSGGKCHAETTSALTVTSVC